MDQDAIKLTTHPGSVLDVACRSSTVSETCKRYLDGLTRLVVSSVRVRGLSLSLCEVPLMVELVVGRCTLLTERLKPIFDDSDGVTQRKDPSLVATHSCSFLKKCQLGLDNLCIVMPIVSVVRENFASWMTSGECGALNGEPSISPFQEGVRVGLRTSNSGMFLGGVLCSSSGDWFPIIPCGGEVQVKFKLFTQEGNEMTEFLPFRQVFSNKTCVSLAKGICDTSRPLMSTVNDVTRQTQSAKSASKGRILCSTNHTLDECASDDCHIACKHLCRAESMFVKPSLLPLATSAPKLGQNSSLNNVSLSGNCETTVSSDGNLGDVWSLVCQPRSLVFYDIGVKGFLPLFMPGRWTLEFFLPQHQVSLTKQIVHIPTNVDKNGLTAIKGAFSIDLPLFLRGEVQTHMHAIWSSDNSTNGDSDNDAETQGRVKVEFDPVIALVMDSDMRWERVSRHVSTSLDCGASLFRLDLFVELSVKLEFYEPQRDGRNGRPTSAFPYRYHSRRAAKKSDVTEEYDMKSETSDIFSGSSPLLMTSSIRECGAVNGAARCDDVATTQRRPKTAAPPPHSLSMTPLGSGMLHNCGQQEQPEGEEEEEQKEEDKGKEREKGGRCVLRPPNNNLQRPATAPQLYPSVEHMVPCYNEHQRRAVFHAYDTNGCGSMTRDQLLHFCRAHVALFDGEESDASILRGLRPYVRGRGGHGGRGIAVNAAAGGHKLRQGEKWSCTPAGQRPRCGDDCGAGFSVDGPEDITYNVFEVIALRLASM